MFRPRTSLCWLIEGPCVITKMLRRLCKSVLRPIRDTPTIRMFGSVQSTRPHASVSQQVEVRSDLARSDAACDVIKLNVGGVKHETTLATLTAIPDTYFTTLFCEASIYRGEVFVDRQGKVKRE